MVDLKYGVGTQEFAVGSFLTSAVVSPDGTRLYVSDSGTGVTHIYNLYADTLQYVGSIPGAYGQRMLLSKDGTRLYLTNYWKGCLQIINTANNDIQTIGIPTPVGLALTPVMPDGETYLLVSSETGGYVAKINVTTDTPTPTGILGGFVQPEEIAIFGAVEAPVLPVTIDIKPGSSVNPINLKSRGKVPVAILGGPAFDVTTVDRGTVLFAGASPLSIGGLPEDVNGDGLLDLVLHFATQDLQLKPGDTQACLTGYTFKPVQEFTGCDTVRILK
jgi:DNA-binding beta-propeller fold protein YncE